MNTTITLETYLAKGKTFVIPDYQRGYIWGKRRVGEKDSVTNLLDDLKCRFRNGTDTFLQGFTVTEKEKEIILIDGQQRTICLFLLLKWLGCDKPFKIQYEIRKKSNDFLKNLDNLDINTVQENEEEDFQDIYFFQKTLHIINDSLKDFDKQAFITYLLRKVKFLYINIPELQARKVFAMMNGNKAKMLPEEVIKAEILRIASLSDDEQPNQTQEWENNMLRSRYAREWDKWLYWWNREDVKKLYRCENTMGLLVSSYLKQKKGEKLTFESFKNKCLKEVKPKEAKQTFDGLRDLQKHYEDTFNDVETHNMIGAILRILDNNNQKKFLEYYFIEGNHREDLNKYYKLVFLGMTHDEIVEKNKDKFNKKYDTTYSALEDKELYMGDNKEYAFRLLLRLNVDQDTLQKRKFNFDIWNDRSLEHIYPKSKVVHKQDEKWYDGENKQVEIDNFLTYLTRDEIKIANEKKVTTTEHSIGNLVLLYKNENCAFNNSEFNKKKEMFFSPNNTKLVKSRHLLHTICVFAEKMKWEGEEIAQNYVCTLDKFEKDYEQLKEDYEYGKQD